METKHGTYVVLFGIQHLFVIGTAEERKDHTVCAQRRLDNVGHVTGLLFVVKIGKILVGYFLMSLQVVVGSVGNAPQLAPAEREQEFHVRGGLAVKAQLFFFVVSVTDFFVLQAQ